MEKAKQYKRRIAYWLKAKLSRLSPKASEQLSMLMLFTFGLIAIYIVVDSIRAIQAQQASSLPKIEHISNLPWIATEREESNNSKP